MKLVLLPGMRFNAAAVGRTRTLTRTRRGETEEEGEQQEEWGVSSLHRRPSRRKRAGAGDRRGAGKGGERVVAAT